MKFVILTGIILCSGFAFADDSANPPPIRYAPGHYTIHRDQTLTDAAGKTSDKLDDVCDLDGKIAVYDIPLNQNYTLPSPENLLGTCKTQTSTGGDRTVLVYAAKVLRGSGATTNFAVFLTVMNGQQTLATGFVNIWLETLNAETITFFVPALNTPSDATSFSASVSIPKE